MRPFPFSCEVCGSTVYVYAEDLPHARERLSRMSFCPEGKHAVLISMREVCVPVPPLDTQGKKD